MAGVNKVILLGRLGKDPETKNLQSGQSVTNFSIATSETWKDKATGEKKETTEWHNCQAWGALSDIISKYVRKGDQLYIEGKIKTRSWEKDGVTRYVTEVIADKAVLIGGNKSDGQPRQSAPAATTNYAADTKDEDSLPF